MERNRFSKPREVFALRLGRRRIIGGVRSFQDAADPLLSAQTNTEAARMAEGDVVWCDLSARDLDGAAAFYGRLFGWAIHKDRAPDGSAYLVAGSGDRLAAGLFDMPRRFQEMGLPCFWMSYVQVRSAAAATDKAKALGGKVEIGPIDAWDGARVALIRDPLGAGFSVIEGEYLERRAENPRHGEPAWNALYVSDVAAVAPFYEALFGWRVAADSAMRGLFDVALQGRSIASLIEAPDAIRGREQYWGVHFAVDDLEAARARLLAEGGSTVFEEDGAVLAKDPDGAAFFLTARR